MIGRHYIDGCEGLEKKNIKKGIKICERAAKLGDKNSSNKLTKMYYCGGGVPKNLEKARYYAEKGADQEGAISSQTILANMLVTASPNNPQVAKKAIRLWTLSAFQGCYHARLSLASRYGNNMNTRDAEGRPNSSVCTGMERLQKRRKQKIQLVMAYRLDVTMKLFWHPRPYGIHDPLPGHSHIPFSTWVLARGGEHTMALKSRTDPLFDEYGFKIVCVTCGKIQQSQQLQVCSRCKAFRYCSKKCQVKHWKAGHKVDCRGHWIEEFFPMILKWHRRTSLKSIDGTSLSKFARMGWVAKKRHIVYYEVMEEPKVIKNVMQHNLLP